MKNWAAGLGALGLTVGTALVFALPPAQSTFQRPEFARIMLVHLPCAFMSIVSLFAAAWHGFKWLKSRQRGCDARSHAWAEICFLYIILTLATGILFSKIQWGDYWHNDPRQVSFLLVALMFGAYFILRQALPDADRRATNSAGYLLAMVLPILFLTFVYPRLEQVKQQSLHPTTTVPKWEFSGPYGNTFLLMFGSLILISWVLTRERSQAIVRSLEVNDAGLDVRGSTASVPVVRPVPLPPQD